MGSADEGNKMVSDAIGFGALGLAGLLVLGVLVRLVLSPAVVGSLLSAAAAVGVAYAFGVVDQCAVAYACWDLSDRLGARIAIGSLRSHLSVSRGSVEVAGVSMDQLAKFPTTAGDKALEVGGAEVTFDPAKSLAARGLVVTGAKLRDVRVRAGKG